MQSIFISQGFIPLRFCRAFPSPLCLPERYPMTSSLQERPTRKTTQKLGMQKAGNAEKIDTNAET